MTTLSKAIEEEGFAIAEGVFAADEISDIAGDFARAKLRRSRAGVRHAMKLPQVAALAGGLKLRGMAQEILGSEAVPFRATLFDKSAEANWLVVWHQDTALPLREKMEMAGWGPWSLKEGVIYAHAPAEALERVVALRVHLDDSGAENGPLRVLPGSHRFGVMDDERIRGLASGTAVVDCRVSRGGVLAMRPLVVHASSKSRVAAPRRVLHIEYAESMRIGDGIELAIA
jgi:ectoine hydroxylase-related dioxygenase (phytanoyl-CoA dioxygenase family)